MNEPIKICVTQLNCSVGNNYFLNMIYLLFHGNKLVHIVIVLHHCFHTHFSNGVDMLNTYRA